MSSKSSQQEKDHIKQQWEEVLCPICMEHPHNAFLLICSSHDKGCRPFICNTSSLLSNCLSNFCESAGGEPPHLMFHVPEFVPNPRLICPLCRGSISGWTIIESARSAMNMMSRSCPFETCDFVGTYRHLVKHVVSIHHSSGPTAADVERLEGSNWWRLENTKAVEDRISTLTEPSEQLEAYTALLEDLKRLLDRKKAQIMKLKREHGYLSRRRRQELKRDRIQKEKDQEQLPNMNATPSSHLQQEISGSPRAFEELGRRLQNVSLNDERPSKKRKTHRD